MTTDLTSAAGAPRRFHRRPTAAEAGGDRARDVLTWGWSSPETQSGRACPSPPAATSAVLRNLPPVTNIRHFARPRSLWALSRTSPPPLCAGSDQPGNPFVTVKVDSTDQATVLGYGRPHPRSTRSLIERSSCPSAGRGPPARDPDRLSTRRRPCPAESIVRLVTAARRGVSSVRDRRGLTVDLVAVDARGESWDRSTSPTSVHVRIAVGSGLQSRPRR